VSEPFLGQVSIFAGNFAPRGFAFCNGQILPISQNTALFSLLGTYYGGNGTTNFGLPNLQGRAPLGQGQGPGLSPYSIGEVTGTTTVTLNQNQVPSHNHLANCDSAIGTTVTLNQNQVPGHNHLANCDSAIGTLPDPGGHAWAAVAGGRGRPTLYATAPSGGPMSAQAIGPAGGNQAHNNLSPYLVVNFIIAMQGIYPSRN
jgi:microcystin-dependent protein